MDTEVVAPSGEQVPRVTEEDRQATNEMLASATLQDRPEAFREVTQHTQDDVTNQDSASSIGRELEITADSIAVSEEINNLLDEVLSLLLSPHGDEQEKTSTERLDQAFDDAIAKVPSILGQTREKRFITFLKCTIFAILLVKRYKERNESDSSIAWVVREVVTLLMRAAVRHALYDYIVNIGGWRALYNTVHAYITGLSSTDNPQGSTLQLPIGSIIILAIIGTVVVGGYVYIRFRK